MPYEKQTIGKDGHRVDILARDTASEKAGLPMAYIIDVTEHKQAGQALHESETLFRQLADSIPQILWAAQPGGHVDYFNRQWFEFTGFSKEQAVKESWRLALHPEDRKRCVRVWHESLRTGQAYQIEYRLKDRAGFYHWHLGRAYPVEDDSGRIVRWFGSCTEIDELKRAHDMLLEQTRQLSEAGKRKDEFLAMLAHELRNPLASIHYALQLSPGNAVQDPFSRRQHEVITQQVNTMTRLVDDLLDISRISMGKFKLQTERVDFRAVVDQIVESFRPIIQEHRYVFMYLKDSNPLWLNGDFIRLEQVIRNLLNNAIKYTETGGRIAVTVERESGSGPMTPAMAVLRVKDSGMGIALEMISRIFDLFTQAEQSVDRAQGGLGIGLTIVRNLVELHGGTVEAFSEGVGKGSEFVVRLPLLEEPRTVERKPKLRRQPLDKPDGVSPWQVVSRRIMVVDDNEDLATFLRELLELWGHAVCVAHDGPSAIEQALAFQPEVALLDIGLPGMNGYQLARLMRTQPELKGTMLVALTGYGENADRILTEQAGFNRHLTKPVELDTLRSLLA